MVAGVVGSPDWVAADDPDRFDDAYLFATHGASSKPAKVAIIAMEMTDNCTEWRPGHIDLSGAGRADR